MGACFRSQDQDLRLVSLEITDGHHLPWRYDGNVIGIPYVSHPSTSLQGSWHVPLARHRQQRRQLPSEALDVRCTETRRAQGATASDCEAHPEESLVRS